MQGWESMVSYSQEDEDRRQAKQNIRTESLRRRDSLSLEDAETFSHHVFDRLMRLPEYRRSKTVMIYVDVRSEVRTRWFFPTLWAEEKTLVVPFCVSNIDLGLFRLQSLAELSPGAMGILEPSADFRKMEERRALPNEIDLVIAPGVAFDRFGGRIGYGKGYYDRLLRTLRPDAIKIAIGYECQIVERIELSPHDVPMDRVITEQAIYPIE
jgi:5-formyltetrahydrofolate cyclo-ligase